jgi:hypothetical protein
MLCHGGAPIWSGLTVKTEGNCPNRDFCSDRKSWPRTHPKGREKRPQAPETPRFRRSRDTREQSRWDAFPKPKSVFSSRIQNRENLRRGWIQNQCFHPLGGLILVLRDFAAPQIDSKRSTGHDRDRITTAKGPNHRAPQIESYSTVVRSCARGPPKSVFSRVRGGKSCTSHDDDHHHHG